MFLEVLNLPLFIQLFNQSGINFADSVKDLIDVLNKVFNWGPRNSAGAVELGQFSA